MSEGSANSYYDVDACHEPALTTNDEVAAAATSTTTVLPQMEEHDYSHEQASAQASAQAPVPAHVPTHVLATQPSSSDPRASVSVTFATRWRDMNAKYPISMKLATTTSFLSGALLANNNLQYVLENPLSGMFYAVCGGIVSLIGCEFITSFAGDNELVRYGITLANTAAIAYKFQPSLFVNFVASTATASTQTS